MANIWGESSYNLNAKSELGAYGLMQWHKDRKDSLFALAKSMKKSPDDLDVQIEMIWKELKGTGDEAQRFSRIMQKSSELERVKDFAVEIERPWTKKQLKESSTAQRNMKMRLNKMKEFMRVIEEAKRKPQDKLQTSNNNNNKISSLVSIKSNNENPVYHSVAIQNPSKKTKIINNNTYKIIEPSQLPFIRSSDFNEMQIMVS